MIRCWLAAGVLLWELAASPAMAKTGEGYRTSGDCDGYPRIGMQSLPGTCVGLVASHLGFARGIAAIGSDIYVADMGGWRKGHGRVLRLTENGKGAPEIMLDHLNEPNALAPGPDGSLYVGELGRVFRFDPKAATPAQTITEVVTGLPSIGRHPLPALAVAADGSLFINIGSKTDHCETENDDPPDPAKPCPETLDLPQRGALLHVMPPTHGSIDARGITPYARGLRNSMALAILPSGQLLAAVNARDAIDKADPSLSDEALPHDTFDAVEQGADYGWPYCYDNNVPSPEYKQLDCSTRHAPDLLLPPHAAPLGMLVYHGQALQGLDGKAIVGYHGYRSGGHRIVAITVDENGHPSGQPREILWDWDVKAGDHPQGAPVGLLELGDGSLLISEDHNGTLLRLATLKH